MRCTRERAVTFASCARERWPRRACLDGLARLWYPASVIDRVHWFYVLRCSDGSLYAGYTVDLNRRLAAHQTGRGARYTRSRRPVALAGTWQFADAASALRAEYHFKRLTRADKLLVVESDRRDEVFAGGLPWHAESSSATIAHQESASIAAEANRGEN